MQENAYHSKEYQELRAKFGYLLDEKYLVETQSFKLNEYEIEAKIYQNKEYWIKQSDVMQGENLIFSYTALDDDADFCEIFEDKFGEKYFIFREDLYGYSVFCVGRRKFYRYFPLQVLKGQEDYIFAGFHYDSSHDIAVVDSCIWGCPWTLLIADFTNPMQKISWLDINKLLEGGCDKHEDLQFLSFSKNGIKLKAYNVEEKIYEQLIVPYSRCRKRLSSTS